MDREIFYLKARRRYMILHLSIMAMLFAAAVLGAAFVPLELAWRIGYALVASVVVLSGVFLTRRWIFGRIQALYDHMEETPDSPEET